MQPTYTTKTEAKRRIPKSVPRWAAEQRHRDRPENLLFTFWQGHGGRDYVRSGEEKIKR